MPQQTLAQRVRAKYPGVYDDLSDTDLEAKVIARYPGVYDDIPRTTAEASPAKRETPSKGVLENLTEGVSELWQKQPIHPIDIVTGTAQAISHPIDTASGILKAQGTPLDRARESFTAGDYQSGVLDVLNYLIPIFGPQISDIQKRYREGDLSAGGVVGASAGVGLQAAIPSAMKNMPARIPVTPGMRNRNPAEAEAVAFGQSRGIPVDAGTATGNRLVRGTQNLADRTIGGGFVSERARAAQEAGLARVSDELASQANKKPVTPYQAGEAVQAGLDKRLTQYGDAANKAYSDLRTLEADPKNTRQVQIKVEMTDKAGNKTRETVTVPMQMPVDLKLAKAQLKPVYDRMLRQMPVAQQRADPALHAIKNILDSPDYLPASMVDLDLSAIKALARTDAPTRNPSQGLAAAAVKTLDTEVQKAVAMGGKDATAALQAGRTATKQKYGVSDLIKQIRDEPRQAFDQAIWANDAGIDRLRAISRESPQALPQIGRAYLDDLFSTATAEGGFSKAQGLQAKWQKLGPQTKLLLFKDPGYIKDLDNFFLLAKKMAENPNPSGTAYVGSIGAQGALMLTEPVTGLAVAATGAALSKLLHSPAGVRALTRGLSVPVGSRAAAASAFGSVVKAAEEQGVRLVPATAEERER